MLQGAGQANAGGAGEENGVEEQPGVVATLLGFFTAFFTSLVPENPQGLVGN
jgi:hypothetical protein